MASDEDHDLPAEETADSSPALTRASSLDDLVAGAVPAAAASAVARRAPARALHAPGGVVEVLRMLAVVFFAGLGATLAPYVSLAPGDLVVPLDPAALGVVLGSGLGYVLGGMLARSTVSSVERVERTLRGSPAEDLVASFLGGALGCTLAAATGWPLLLLRQPYIAFPLFGFYFVTAALLAARLARHRRAEIIAAISHRVGHAEPLTPSSLPRLIDTSVAIDGRILEVVRAGFLTGTFLVCTPVLAELQGLADATDSGRRAKGRRGLELLDALRREPGVQLEVLDEEVPSVAEVDAKLMRLAIDRELALLTLDTNLAKAASLAGVRVLNLHSLTLALRPAVAAGDEITVRLTKPGREQGQAVGYLDDGTMVVVERGREHVGETIEITVTSVLVTANGRMVFARASH